MNCQFASVNMGLRVGSALAVSALLFTAFASGCGGGGGPSNQPPPASSPAIAYQIDAGHSGSAAFGTVLTFPQSPTWSVNLGGAISYPLIVGNKVYVTTSNMQLYALNKSTGAIVWGPKQIGGAAFNRPWSGLTYDRGRVIVQSWNGLLESFDALTGQPGWSVQLPGQFAFSSAPTATNGIVYVGGAGSGGTVYAVDDSTGAILWTAPVANGDQSSPAVALGPGAGGIFVSYPCQVYSFHPTTGVLLWHFSGACSGGGGKTPALKNGKLYVRDFAGDAAGIYDAATGVKIGSFDSITIPALGDTTGFFRPASGGLQAVDLLTGTVKWSFAGDGQITSAPILIDNTVLVGSGSGTVYALNASTGSQLWSGSAGAPIPAPDEQNVSQPLTGLSAGEGYLVVPAGSTLTAWHLAGP